MGIQGLLPFIKKSSRAVNLRAFKGQTAAVDAYCWLHKGAFSCADKLVRGEPTDGYVLYIMKQVNQLLSYDIKPILVFDGCNLPSKSITEKKRRDNREKNRKKAKELLREGKAKEARECFQRCVDVTSEMASEVIKACRARNVDIIVAPYEADSQLAYLNRCGIAHLVITEDSDLILFGCKRVLFKMDSNGGGVLVDHECLNVSMNMPRDKFTFEKFVNMCILSGCDYLPSLPGIGLAKACKFFTITSNPDTHNALCKIPSYLKMPHLEVTKEYRDEFMKAKNTFLYQLVFDPVNRVLRPLTEYPDDMGPEDYPYAGAFVGHERALQIALGNVNVQTGEVVDYFCPDTYKPPEPKSSGWDKRGDICTSHRSIWSQDFTPTKPEPAMQSLLSKEKQSTLGKELHVSSTPAFKRKWKPESVPDDDGFPTEDELQDLYAVPAKRMKQEASLDHNDDSDDINGKTALEHLADGLDLEEATAEVQAIKEEVSSPELKTEDISPMSNKSKNPFAKAKSPVKASGQFSALKRFTKIRKSLENSNVIVQSRYFSTSQTTIPDKKDDKEIKNEKVPEMEVSEKKTDETSEKNSEISVLIPSDESQEEQSAKPPLSPVNSNVPTNNQSKSFKWGKLTDMFAHNKDKVKIESSPATNHKFKFVKRTVLKESEESKENTLLVSQDSDSKDVIVSQSSVASEVSSYSDVGSVDNESFGLTPTPEQNEKLAQDSGDTSPSSMSHSVCETKAVKPVKRDEKKGRGVGLSRPSTGKKKNTDSKQLSLKDMFAFKKVAPKL